MLLSNPVINCFHELCNMYYLYIQCISCFHHGLSRLCYGLRQYIPGVAPEVLPCVPVRSDTPRLCPGHRRQSPGVTTANYGSRTAKLRCYNVAFKYQ